MNCPVCKTSLLIATDLAGLSVRRCGSCGGQWVNGEIYLNWVAKQGVNLPEKQPDSVVELPVTDSTKAKLCPDCGRLLVRAKVGHGVAFQLDRCGGCGGIWFDANEWEALAARNLHDNVHFIFSSAWQADIKRRDRQAQHDKLMVARLGEADWKEIQRIRAWIENHPKRSELYAALSPENG